MWERNIDRLPPAWLLLEIEPAIKACALMGNQRAFGACDDTHPTEPHRPELLFLLFVR